MCQADRYREAGWTGRARLPVGSRIGRHQAYAGWEKCAVRLNQKATGPIPRHRLREDRQT